MLQKTELHYQRQKKEILRLVSLLSQYEIKKSNTNIFSIKKNFKVSMTFILKFSVLK